MRKICFVFMIFLLSFASCKNAANTTGSGNIPQEEIVFFSYKITNANPPDSFIKNKRYVKIDGSRDELLFGKIEKVKIINNKIYIFDWHQRSLTVYNMDGSGIGKVGEQGRGPHEYLQISDFDVDEDGNVYIWDGQGDQLYTYDKYFKFIRSVKPSFDIDLVKCLPDHKLMFCLTTWNTLEHAGTKILITDEKLNVLEKQMVYDEYIDNNYLISGNAIVQTDKNIIFNQTNHNNVYLFSLAGELEKIFTFNFGSKNVPNEDKKDIEGKLKKYDNYCVLQNFTVISDKYLLGTIWLNRKTKLFLANRETKEVYLGETIEDYDFRVLAGCSDNTIISFLTPEKYQYPDLRGSNIPEDVISHLENGNFVLCLYELN